MTYFILRDRDTSTDIVTSVPAGLIWNRSSICGRGKSVFSFAKRPDRFCAYPSSYSIATDIAFHSGSEAGHLPLFINKFKNERSCTSFSFYVFMACTRTFFTFNIQSIH